MKILALDTSMGACSAAVLSGKELFARQEAMERGHAEALMPMVAEVLAEAEIRPAALDVIAATTGPGSFTGVRIAIAAARGLALVTGAKLFGIDSLSVMAKTALAEGLATGGPYAVAVDARRGMLYLGLYDAAGREARRPAADHAGRCCAWRCHASSACAVGSGAGLLAEAARAARARDRGEDAGASAERRSARRDRL